MVGSEYLPVLLLMTSDALPYVHLETKKKEKQNSCYFSGLIRKIKYR